MVNSKHVLSVYHYIFLISLEFQWRIQGGGKGGANAALWRRVMYFCVHNCTSLSNDYAGLACSNNNQAPLQFLTDLETFD